MLFAFGMMATTAKSQNSLSTIQSNDTIVMLWSNSNGSELDTTEARNGNIQLWNNYPEIYFGKTKDSIATFANHLLSIDTADGRIKPVAVSDIGFIAGYRGQTTFSGITSTTVYTITHGLGYTPVAVFLQPRSDDAAERHYFINNITATTFDIVFLVAPAVGTNNIIFDLIAIR